MTQFNASNWIEEFNNPPTTESLDKVPIFSGLRISDYVVFHSGFKTSTSIESLNFPPRFLEIAIKEFGLKNLYGLLLIPFHEFLLYPRVDKLLIYQSQKIIHEFILKESKSGMDNIAWSEEHFWVIDKDGFPVKMPKWKITDPISSMGLIKEKIDSTTIQKDQIANRITGIDANVLSLNRQNLQEGIKLPLSENRYLENNEEGCKHLIRRTKLFMGSGSVTISSEQFSRISINSIFALFSVRFINVLKKCKEIKSLQDLLNTSYDELLKVRNCGIKSIDDAKLAILSLDYYSLVPTIKLNENNQLSEYNFPFFEEKGIVGCQPTDDKLNTSLQKLDFPVRFQSFLVSHHKITKVKDILEIPISLFEKNKNIGRITIGKVQETIREFLASNNEEFVIPTITETSEEENCSKRYDELIVNRIISLLGERNSKVLLMRYSYEAASKLTLEEIGASFDITRERARQIIESCEKRLSGHSQIFKELVQFVKAGPVVTNFKIIINALIESNLWSPKNGQFLRAIMDRYFSKDLELFVEDDYLLTVSLDVIRKKFQKLLEEVNCIIQDSKERIEMDFVISRLKETMELPESDANNFINNVTVSFLADKYKKFHVVEDGVYNEVLYQVRYGRYLKDVVYSSMKYLGEPVHFRQLAEFIRSNNERNKDTSDQTIHSTLVNSNYAHDVDRGIYALVDSKIPKYVTTWNAIKSLLQESGPLLEDEIYELLRMKYSSWSIQMAIENNRNRLLRIGNDMFDLKGKNE
jgi:hypothetical protein